MKLSENEKKRLLNNYGPWALVTGASSGIGLELAERLAESGLNLVIHSRSENVLTDLAKRLQSTYTIKVEIVAADVATPEGVQKIIQDTSSLPIGMLIVSAGFGTSGEFIHTSIHSEINMLRVNCEALVTLTHHFAQKYSTQNEAV